MPGTSKLLSYIQSMSGDATKLREFHTDPAAAAKSAGLSSKEVSALLSRNPGAIAAAIGKVGGQGVAVGGGHGSAAAGDDINVTIVVVVAP